MYSVDANIGIFGLVIGLRYVLSEMKIMIIGLKYMFLHK